MRALFVLVACLLAGRASADIELPTIESEHPPTLRISNGDWGTRIERVAVVIRSAPEPTFVTIDVTGRKRTVILPLDVPPGTKVFGLGVDSPNGRVWGRPMPAERARLHQFSESGSAISWDSTSADEDHLTLSVNVPATIELALYLPPLPQLAIATDASVLSVDVDGVKLAGKQHRVVVALDDIAGTGGEIAMPSATEQVGLVATPTPPSEFAPNPPTFGPRVMRDIDKTIIRRRMKWYRANLRECFMKQAQWANNNTAVRRGGTILTFMIAPSGDVEWARTSESDLPASVTDCLVEEVRRWEFPDSDGSVEINYPLDFRTYD